MTRFRALIIGVAYLVLLSGCASLHHDTQDQRMAKALATTAGKSIAAYAASHGLPQETVKLSDTQEAFRWVITGQGAGAIIPLSGMLVTAPSQTLTCTIILTAHTVVPNPELKDWFVEAAEWRGAC